MPDAKRSQVLAGLPGARYAQRKVCSMENVHFARGEFQLESCLTAQVSAPCPQSRVSVMV